MGCAPINVGDPMAACSVGVRPKLALSGPADAHGPPPAAPPRTRPQPPAVVDAQGCPGRPMRQSPEATNWADGAPEEGAFRASEGMAPRSRRGYWLQVPGQPEDLGFSARNGGGAPSAPQLTAGVPGGMSDAGSRRVGFLSVRHASFHVPRKALVCPGGRGNRRMSASLCGQRSLLAACVNDVEAPVQPADESCQALMNPAFSPCGVTQPMVDGRRERCFRFRAKNGVP